MQIALFVVAGLLHWVRCDASDEFVSLLQAHARILQSQSGCSSLANHGSYFSTQIQAGTEAQQLDVVVDTGSDELVVPSCSCSKCKGKCLKQVIPSNASKVKISYGSGDIQAVVMSGPVKVGSVHADMHESMLVMVQDELDLEGNFEGILALGPPHREGSKKLLRLPGGEAALADKPLGKDYFYTKSFLEEASITRFSLCFNKASSGALRLGDAAHSGGDELGSVGEIHWGLGLSGVSVGSESGDLAICSKSSSSKGGSDSPCGAIPDSGTTLMMGPASQITALYAALCKEWSPCKSSVKDDKTDVGSLGDAVKEIFGDALLASTFQDLIEKCEDLDSLPPLYFHLTGSGGSAKTISIPGSAYVYRDSSDCIPAFDTLEYNTEKNGPVWILGMPLFMEYTVTYDVGKNPPSMSFASGGCAGCSGSLFRNAEDGGEQLQWQISRKLEPLRKPKLDLTQPL